MCPEEATKEGERLSIEESVTRIKETFSGYDGKELAENVNKFSQAIMAARRESPELALEAFPAIEAAFTDIDFGKMREAVSALLDYVTPLTLKMLEASTDNPVIIANIVGMIPPLVNTIINILSGLLEKLELPPEILASALFNVLAALDADELGRVLSTLSKQVKALHAGTLILGGDEPRARAVTDDIVRKVLENLDVESLADAVIALGEDTEVITGVLVGLVLRDPALIDVLTRMAVELTNITTRVLSNALDQAAALPEDVLAEMGADGRVIDTVDIGRSIDSFVTYALRLRNANPGLHREMYTGALRSVNTEQAEIHLRTVAGDLVNAAVSNRGIKKALEPEEVGARINEMLTGFNRSVRPIAARDYLSRLLAAVDSRELEAAVKTSTGVMIDAAFMSAKTATSLMKAVASGAWKLTKNIFRLLARR